MAAVVSLTPTPVQRFYDNNNNPLVGGKLYTYAAGTTNPINSYTDSTGATPNTNPVIMNARGECQVWLSEGTAYKLVLEDSAGNMIWTVDGVIAAAGQEIFYPSNMIPTTNVGTIIVTGVGVMEWSSVEGAYVPESAGQQALSYSLGSNALTLGFTPQGPLTFRNPTLLNGVPVVLPMPSAALSITIPSGATLGTVSGVPATLVLMVAYNGGSPVLCVGNLAGMADLSETTLISPTTISAGATSASVIYSASAVGANSPYKVVGIVVETQTTTGTWASNPTQLQGTGGQLLVSRLAPATQQVVNASVASNALTATFTAREPLAFRNTSLTSGTPLWVPAPAQLSITVPAGATLGTVSGVPSQFALLVAYNGGSPVLCVVNLASGIELDETNLVSPTTISAGATSASAIYSASAVSASSPYRVVGLINMPGQTTAGTWATAPAQAQGAGGLSNVDLGMLGLINNTGASSDLALAVGQGCYIDVAGATSVPLHVATGDNQIYEIDIQVQGSTGSAGDVILNPNNTTYTNFFASQILAQSGSSVTGLNAFTNGFALTHAGMDPRSIISRVSTKTISKTALSTAYGYNTSVSSIYQTYVACGWQASASSNGGADLTTLYTSLGTLVFPVAATGEITIRRIR